MFKHKISLFGSRIPTVVFIGILVIPLIYGVLYLWAFWDPYGRLEQMPIAVVNQDEGASRDEHGSSVWYRYGDDVTTSLRDEGGMKWEFVDEQRALQGLEEKTYYSVLTIPADFSRNILSVDTDTPVHAVVSYKTREASSFMAAKFAGSAYIKIQQSINKTITKKYADNLFVDIRDSADDLQKAADGASDLSDGLSDAKDGSDTLLHGVSSAEGGAKSLHAGISDLHTGAIKLQDGLTDAATGSAALSENLTHAYEGSVALATGSGQLVVASDAMRSGLVSVTQGTTQLVTSATQIQTGLTGMTTSTQQLSASAKTASDLLSQYAAAYPESSSSAVFQQLVQTVGGISSGLDEVSTVSASLLDGQKQTVGGLTSLQTSLGTMKSGGDAIVTGMQTLDAGIGTAKNGLSALADGSTTITKGILSLKDGSGDLVDGLAKAEEGSGSLWDGIVSIWNGQNSLLEGLIKAKDGIAKLRDKLTDAVVSTRNKTEPTKNDRQSDVISEPIQLMNTSIALVENNGTGFTPYFAPLALWVGIMALFFFLSPEEKTHSLKTLAAKLSAVGVTGVAQSAVLGAVLLLLLRLKVKYLGLFFVFLMLLSFAYGVMQFFFTYIFKDVGKFINILILMLQLTTSAGSYPLETLPDILQKIHPYLPMTYAVDALREIISGGSMPIIYSQIVKIMLLTVIFITINGVVWMKPGIHLARKERYERKNRI